MRWCAALAVVLVALVVVTVRGLRRPAKRPPPTDAELAALDPDGASLPDVSSARATSAASIRRDGGGIAHLRGRVLFPAGVHTTGDLEVVAESLARRVSARILGDDGRFEIRLPAGRYMLVASAGVLVGVVPDVLAPAGVANDVDIRLAAGATIRGKVHAPDGAGVEVRVVPSGRGDETGETEIDEDRFSVEGLIAGRRYDVTFSGADVRKQTLTGITAPADGLHVELVPRAVVRGAIGFTDDECPISTVELQVDGKTLEDDAGAAPFATLGHDCAFALPVPDQVTAVTVVATGEGWHLEEAVTIPPGGDPEPLCLNPPCREAPRRTPARLHVTLEGDPAPREITAVAAPAGPSNPRSRQRSCSGAEATCDIEGLKVGETFSISAGAPDCRATPVPITVAAGDNHVRIRCVRERQIEGVVRFGDSDEASHRIFVRCPGDDAVQVLYRTRLFQLTCRADARAVEYQIGGAGTWRSVPVASAPAEAPGFVDITPL